MPIPNVKQAMSDVVAVLKEAGGQATSRQISESLLGKWRLTEEERSQPDSWAPRLYIKQMYRAINKLKREGRISNVKRGICSARESPPPPKGETETARLTHDELRDRIGEMGETLGKIAEVECEPVFKHDCVWRDNPYANPKVVWEVCDRGNLDKDIASLTFAARNWGARGILVIFEESDFQAAQKKLAQEPQVWPLRAEDPLKLHSLLQGRYAQAIRAIFAS